MAGPRTCPACDEPAPAEANWCEACGADLAAGPAARCVACGGGEIADDGYCMACGHKQPTERDHVEIVDQGVVAVSDRGLRHQHNEDAVAIAQLPSGGAVLIVCDGVSSTAGSAEASAAAAVAARDALVDALGIVGDADEQMIEQALLAATDAAQTAAATAPEVESSRGGPPSSTFVGAVALLQSEGLRIGVAWLGDSRAYWLDDRGVAALTEDHEIDGSLTRWLGVDSGRIPPGTASHVVDRPGMLLLCSDGLWRYTEPAPELHALVQRLLEKQETPDDLALAQDLVKHALDEGGHDNISVALWTSPGPWPANEPSNAESKAEESDNDE